MYDFIDYLNNENALECIGCTICLYALLFPITDSLLMICLSKYRRYNKIRQYNIISNILKSFVLAFIAWCFISIIINNIEDIGDNQSITNIRVYALNLTALYCTTDIVALIVNYEGLQFSTQKHHVVVAFVYIYSVYIADFNNHGIYMAMIMYGAFSSIAFLVNTYLGARFLLPAWAAIQLKRLALISYVLACSLNWIFQICYCSYLLYIGNNYISVSILSIMICIWVYDDCKLIDHLMHAKIKKNE